MPLFKVTHSKPDSEETLIHPDQDWLWKNWLELLTLLGIQQPLVQRSFADILAAYSSSGRYYHTLGHIAQVLWVIEAFRGQASCMPTLQLAGWLHDVIYDTNAKDNEVQSAAYARQLLQSLEISENRVSSVERLILLTQGHQVEVGEQDGKFLLDADLAILGSPPSLYQFYSRAIRQEYAWVPSQDYQVARKQVLQGFLARPQIYNTHLLYEQLEVQARQNLQSEIQKLDEENESILSLS